MSTHVRGIRASIVVLTLLPALQGAEISMETFRSEIGNSMQSTVMEGAIRDGSINSDYFDRREDL